MIRVARIVLTWALLTVVAALVLAVSVPQAFGFEALTVMSGSMEPSVATGDVVLNRVAAPLDVRVGDVVTFRDPQDETRLITHRVRSVRVTGDLAEFVTKGDANDTTEEWATPVDGTLGVVRYRIPRAGYLLAWMRLPWARFVFLVIPALLLGAVEIWRIWRPGRREASRVAA